jgi:hypothetical protein
MPKIQIEVTYDPRLEYYPPNIQNKTDAMLFDMRQIESGEADIGLLIDNDVKIVGVVDDEGKLHEL